MVFLLYDCRIDRLGVILNEEFSDYAWVTPEGLREYDLNHATVDTFRQLGCFPADVSA